jgi:hypothetical protein
MTTGFVEILIRPPKVRGRRRRRCLTVTTRSGVRCEFTGGVPVDLAREVMALALRWRGRQC